MSRSILLIAIFAAALLSDIPDYDSEWDMFVTCAFHGAAEVEDFIASERGTEYRLLCTTKTENITDVWLLDLSSRGAVLSRAEITPDDMSSTPWAAARFMSENVILILYGSDSGSEARISVLNLGRPENSWDLPLSGLYPEAQDINITSAEPSDSGVLIAGCANMGEEGGFLFAACVDQEGSVIWKTNLEPYECGLAGTTLVPLDEGCILSVVPDSLGSGISTYRLSSEGESTWSSVLELDWEFHASINDFIEMANGNIICTGSCDPMTSDGYRGITVCLDPSGQELWRRIDWYLDHASFTECIDSDRSVVALAGWTGLQKDYMLDVYNSDVLIALLNIEQDRIIGFRVRREGDQRPAIVHPSGEGGMIVVGENTTEDSTESQLFLGRVFLEL